MSGREFALALVFGAVVFFLLACFVLVWLNDGYQEVGVTPRDSQEENKDEAKSWLESVSDFAAAHSAALLTFLAFGVGFVVFAITGGAVTMARPHSPVHRRLWHDFLVTELASRAVIRRDEDSRSEQT